MERIAKVGIKFTPLQYEGSLHSGSASLSRKEKMYTVVTKRLSDDEFLRNAGVTRVYFPSEEAAGRAADCAVAAS